MQALSLARHFFQIIAFAIFAYQMIVALNKYASFATFPYVETKGIADVKLPDVFVCPKQRDMFDGNGIGYSDMLNGIYSGNSTSFVSWEGNDTMLYENMTRQLFTKIYEFSVHGNPLNNWNVEGKALNF